MKLTNFQIIMYINTLQAFSEKKLPQKLAYAITKNLMVLEREYECYQKLLQQLVNKYKDDTLKDDEGNALTHENGMPKVKKEKEDAFNSELESLLGIEVKINLYYVPEKIFEYDDTINKYDILTAKDIFQLQDILIKKETIEAEVVDE